MITLLEPALSAARIGTYMAAAGHDETRALALYMWNVQLGESFHLPIQAVEIAFRNRVNGALVLRYGPDWWGDAAYLSTADKKQADAIAEVQNRIVRRAAPVVTGQIVAGLSFGFWVSMLDQRYNPTVWSTCLNPCFPDLPTDQTRDRLQTQVRAIASFRNRIWHHEPIFKADITKEYSRCIKTLGWICQHKVQWVKPQCRVMSVLRMRP